MNEEQQDIFAKHVENIQLSFRALINDSHFKHLNIKSKNHILLTWATEWQDKTNISFFESFITLILENDRQDDLLDILQCVYELYCDQRKILNIHVITAKLLKKNEKQHLQDTLGQNDHIKYTVDNNLLGGAIIKIGSTIKDESTRAYLLDIQAQLMEAL